MRVAPFLSGGVAMLLIHSCTGSYWLNVSRGTLDILSLHTDSAVLVGPFFVFVFFFTFTMGHIHPLIPINDRKQQDTVNIKFILRSAMKLNVSLLASFRVRRKKTCSNGKTNQTNPSITSGRWHFTLWLTSPISSHFNEENNRYIACWIFTFSAYL